MAPPISIVTVRPNQDSGPNTWAGTTPHWQQVDDSPFPDLDTTRLTTSTGGQSEAYGINTLNIIPVGSLVSLVRVRAWMKGTTVGVTTIRVGYRAGGKDFWGSNHTVPADLTYRGYESSFPINGFTGDVFEWNQLRNAVDIRIESVSVPFGLPRPSLTQLVLFATIPLPTSPLIDTEIEEFWRLHRLAKRGLISLQKADQIFLAERYEYLGNRADLNGQSLKPPRDLIDSDYDPARPTGRRKR